MSMREDDLEFYPALAGFIRIALGVLTLVVIGAITFCAVVLR